MKKWKLLHRIVKLQSRWVTVYADKLLDDKGKELEYWHYERPDSVIVVVVQDGKFILPAKTYRVGIEKYTLDFTGGRVDEGQSAKVVALQLLKKELGLEKAAVVLIKPINKLPFAVDSSFSTQQLHGYVAIIDDKAEFDRPVISYPLSSVSKLKKDLTCAQCRLVLHEFLDMEGVRGPWK